MEDASLALYSKHAPLLRMSKIIRLAGLSLTYVSRDIGLQLDKIFLSAELSPANYGAAGIRHWTLERNTEDNTSQAKAYYNRFS
jgi:hypothetical protein